MPPSAWTREELESLNEEVEQNRDAELGELWRSDFAQDLDGLYDYVGAATAEWQQVVHDLYRLPQNEWQVCVCVCVCVLLWSPSKIGLAFNTAEVVAPELCTKHCTRNKYV
eukprot:1157502-Pelagomonas_calceolata.AAC.4